MRVFITLWAVALAVLGCGGGDDRHAGTPLLGTVKIDTGNNFGASSTTENVAIPTECGVEVGPSMIAGTVTDVHDGDTITINSAFAGTVKVRLDSIDAPELAQPFGDRSRDALSAAVLGTIVKVAYSKTDQYGRTVGAVFTGDCHYVNLDLVSAGLAWFYKAYQCEISATTREKFDAAQASASQAGIGLWSQPDPVPPWFFRNGSDPVAPTCGSDLPSWVAGSSTDSTDSTGSTGSTGTTTALACGTKNSCAQMSSCQEATYFLRQCKVVSLDGDGDGIPCENICR